MNLSEYINCLNTSNKLVDLNLLLEKAECRITFWGGRVVTVKGYVGSIELDRLVCSVLDKSRERSESDDLSTKERLVGIGISTKLNNFYHITDTLIRKANWFTRLLNYLREFTFIPYTSRFYAEEGVIEDHFRGYSEQRFIREFGGRKTGYFGEYEHSDGGFGPPFRVKVLESAIRAKINKFF